MGFWKRLHLGYQCKAYRLPQRYVIHTVGPRYYACDNPAEVLGRCYRNALALADSLGCHSIAFPSISTGAFGYPVEEAAEVAAAVLFAYKATHLESVCLCVYPGDRKTLRAYEDAFGRRG